MDGWQFKLFGFPVLFTPQVLLLVGVFVLLGLSWGWSLSLIAGTAVIAVISILFHELGHALTAKLFGLGPISITLHGLGGVTRHRRADRAWKELLIVVAGPTFGMVAAGVALVASLLPLPELLGEIARQALVLNVMWSVFNMLPIFPLDGGNALSAFLQVFVGPGVAWPVTWGVGLAGAVGLGLLAWIGGEIFILLFAGSFAFQNFQMLQSWRAARAGRDAG